MCICPASHPDKKFIYVHIKSKSDFGSKPSDNILHHS